WVNSSIELIKEINPKLQGYGDWITLEVDGKALSDKNKFFDLKIVGLHTPGHTPESMCWAVYTGDGDQTWGVFTGDTLFFGDTGRECLCRRVATAAHHD
ncbi:MAG: hypothetical protein RLO21_02890, partial [Nitratireductor sp.]